MPPSPQCSAVAAAQARTGKSYSDIAREIGKSEQHVIDICTGSCHPSATEFNALAKVLGITSTLPHDAAHASK